ncbi:Ribosomal protein S6--L-glutamate ligase [bioreactor metagenome]|uniref:Ribosomal protein S6--L-glutamate ligase n=1 Tax=bioreactor metagenome TaxID=1076179 RepID=A0A645C1Y2_9ZZZZ
MTNKIVVFGGNVKGSKFIELKDAADKLGIDLELVSYKQMSYETENGKILIDGKEMKDYDVYFFRSTKKYWEEVSLILDNIDKNKIVVDPIVRSGRPGDVCKAYQMLVLSQAGLPVPKSIYGSLGFLKKEAVKRFEFPIIIKGSRGDRRKQVFKVYGKTDFKKWVDELKVLEKNGENKYMLQEYIVNKEDFRVMVLGDKVLGVMRRGIGDNPRLKNVFEKTDLPDKVKQLAVEAAKKCGIWIAGVDVVFRNDDMTKPLFFEVNRTPNYTRFVEVTGIDVASEVVKFLANLEK